MAETSEHIEATVAPEPEKKPTRRRVAKKTDDSQEVVSAPEKKPTRRRTTKKAPADQNTTEEATVASSESVSPAEKPARKTRTRKVTTRVKAEVADAAEEAEAKPKRTVRVKAESVEESAPKPRRTTRAKKTTETPATEAPAAPPSEGSAASAESTEAAPVSGDAKKESAAVEPSVSEEKSDHPASEKTSEGEGGDNQKQRRNQKQNRNDKKNGSRNKDNHRRSRRQDRNRREPVVPQTTREDLEKLKVIELRAKAAELNVESKGLKKAELVEAVLAASVKAEGFIETEGVLDIMPEGYGFLRTSGYLPSEHDVYVGLSTIRRNGLRKGDYIKGTTRPQRANEKYSALQEVATVNDIPQEELGRRIRFSELTPIFPDERLVLEHGANTITARVIDLCAPIGKGQRGLIVSPPKAGKTTILKDIAASIHANNPEVHLMCLLVDERPEEVTDMQRSIHGEVISSTFDMPCENHVAVAEMVIERAKRLVETGKDVVILLDSITRLARAYNLAQPASGRILSGGVDSTALYPPKKFLGAARNIEGGGSLTILASALIETGSKMDEVIFEEFKGTGNMEVKLDRALADRRVFPAIDPVSSGTRREDLLLDPQEAPLIWAVRRILANQNNTERAMNTLIKSLKQTRNNQEFLLRAAKKAQGRQLEGNIDL